MEINLTIFKGINITIIKKEGKKFLIIHSKNYYNKYMLDNNINIYLSKNCRTLVLKSRKFLKNLNAIAPVINDISYSVTQYYFKKIQFTGKSYKIKKKKDNLILEFNKSHIELFT